MCMETKIYAQIFAENPALYDRIDHADIQIGGKICSARVWLIGQTLPVYFIFDRDGDNLTLSHGVDLHWPVPE